MNCELSKVIPSTILVKFDSYYYEREQVNELYYIFYKHFNNSEFQGKNLFFIKTILYIYSWFLLEKKINIFNLTTFVQITVLNLIFMFSVYIYWYVLAYNYVIVFIRYALFALCYLCYRFNMTNMPHMYHLWHKTR